MTTDWRAAMKFYEQVFDWQPSEAMDMGSRAPIRCSIARTG